MLDNKIFFTFIAMILAVFAISKSKVSPDLIENWMGMPNLQTSVNRVTVDDKGNVTSSGLLNNNPLVNSPNYQATNCGSCGNNATVKYSQSTLANLSVPNDNDMVNMAKEKYTRENYGSSSLRSISASKATETGNNLPTSMVAMQDMTTVDVQGNAQQVHVFDQYMYANAKSRLRGQSDHIRGDLPIVPCKKGNFDISVNLNTDLNPGALAAMGGIDMNSTAAKTAQLIYAASGNTNTTLGGVNMAQTFASMGSQMAEMNVSSFA